MSLWDGTGSLTALDITTLSSAVKGLSVNQQAAVLAAQDFNATQIAQVLAVNNATESQIAAALASQGLSGSTKELTYEQAKNNIAVVTGNAEKTEALMQTLGLTAGEEGELIVEEDLTREKILNAAAQQGLNAQQAEGIVTTLGYGSAVTGLTAKMKGLATSVATTAKAIGTATASFVVAHPIITAIVVACAALTAVYVTQKKMIEAADKSVEQLTSSMKENSDTLKTQVTELDDLISKYKELSQKEELTTDDKLELQSIQEKLNTSYGAEADSIDLVNGKYDEQIKKLKELKDAKEGRFVESTISQLKTSDFEFASEDRRRNDINGVIGENATNIYRASQNSLTPNKYTVEKELDNIIAARMLEYVSDIFQNHSAKYGIDQEMGGFSSNSTLEQRLQYYKDYLDYLDKTSTVEEKNTMYYMALQDNLISKINEFEQELETRKQNLIDIGKQYAEAFSIEIDGKNITIDDLENVPKDVVEQFKQGLIKEFATDKNGTVDETVSEAINTYIGSLFEPKSTAYSDAVKNVFMAFAIDGDIEYNGELYRKVATKLRDLSVDELTTLSTANQDDLRNFGSDVVGAIEDAIYEEPVEFNIADFWDEQGIADINKNVKDIKKAYATLEKEGTVEGLLASDEDFFNNHQNFIQYKSDVDTLKKKMEEFVKGEYAEALEILNGKYYDQSISDEERAGIKNALDLLTDYADVTTNVEESTTKTSDLYKDQKKQIQANIQALKREIQAIDKQIDSLEKKKDAQEDYIEQLEKEKDRIEDLIDKYEQAADSVEKVIDKQIDGIKKQQDAIENSYETQIKALKDNYESQIDAIEAKVKGMKDTDDYYDKQIESIEVQIKAIQKQGDEQERVNKLKEKELALEKAKEQMVRVYDATRGWVNKSLIL